MTRLLIVAVLTLCAMQAGAQEIPARTADSLRIDKKNSRTGIVDFQKELGLTPEQAAKWDLIAKQSRDKLATLNDTATDRDKLKDQRMLIMKEQEKQLQEILTTEQKGKLQELRKERRQKATDKQ